MAGVMRFDWQSPFDWQPITWQLLQGI